MHRYVRRFSTTTQDLLALADWLDEHKVGHVAMEATGVYWKPVWHMLENRFTLVLANAAHVRNVPGRKSDVNDATWISDLLARHRGAMLRCVRDVVLSGGESPSHVKS